MHHQKQKSTWLKNFFKSQLLLCIFLLIILGLLIVPMISNLKKRSALDKEIQQLKTEVTRGENQTGEFKKMIEYLSSTQFVEEQARLNMNLKKQGENVVSIKDMGIAKTTEQAQAEQQKVNEPEPPFSVKVQINHWLDYFFGQS